MDEKESSASTRGVVSCVAEASETFFFSREVRNLLYDLRSRESRVFSISYFFIFFVILFYFSHFKHKSLVLPNCSYISPTTHGCNRTVGSEWLSRPNSLDWPLNVNVIRRLRSNLHHVIKVIKPLIILFSFFLWFQLPSSSPAAHWI